jgi:Mg2+ and Co2+ transporter CorA
LIPPPRASKLRAPKTIEDSMKEMPKPEALLGQISSLRDRLLELRRYL